MAAATALHAVVRAAESATGWQFPSWGEMTLQIAWMLGVLAIAFFGFALVVGRRPTLAELGLGKSDTPEVERTRLRRLAIIGGAGCALALASLGPMLAHNSRATGSTPTAPSLGLIVATVALRWPVSSIAQQVLFFGWLQPRLGRFGPAIAVALFSAFHIANPAMMIVTIPLGGIFALERWATGRLHAGIVTHFVVNIIVSGSALMRSD